MNLTPITSVGSRSLADLEQAINDEEQLLPGPVVDLGNDGLNTIITFDMDALPPGGAIVLRTTPGGQTPSVPGHVLICQGNCIVFGQLMGVAAFRAGQQQAQAGAPPAGPAVNPGSALAQTLTSELATALIFKAFIDGAALAQRFAPSIIAGIGSVESGWGTSHLMKPNGPAGTGDAVSRSRPNPNRPGRSMPTDGLGFGRGLMQIDWDAHEFARTGNWQDPQANISFGASVLASNRDSLAAKVGDADLLAASILAYNTGVGGLLDIISKQGSAILRAPGTYTFRVLQRAAFYQSNGFT